MNKPFVPLGIEYEYRRMDGIYTYGWCIVGTGEWTDCVQVRGVSLVPLVDDVSWVPESGRIVYK
jgi:hypothetical protein